MDAVHAHDHDHGHDHHPSGLMRWVKTTNHKDIGTLYLWFSLFMFFFAGSLAMLIRAELFQPGMQLVRPEMFNQLTTMRGNAMSGAPIIRGTCQFAKPTKPGIIAPKIMIRPCMVVS